MILIDKHILESWNNQKKQCRNDEPLKAVWESLQGLAWRFNRHREHGAQKKKTYEKHMKTEKVNITYNSVHRFCCLFSFFSLAIAIINGLNVGVVAKAQAGDLKFGYR